MQSNSNSKMYNYYLANGATFIQQTSLTDLSKICREWEINESILNIGRYMVKSKDLIMIEQSIYKE